MKSLQNTLNTSYERATKRERAQNQMTNDYWRSGIVESSK
jgi:hypothetical protein